MVEKVVVSKVVIKLVWTFASVSSLRRRKVSPPKTVKSWRLSLKCQKDEEGRVITSGGEIENALRQLYLN